MNGNLVLGKDLTIAGRLNVKNFTSQNIINTTTNNYQLIVSEDLSLNGRLVVSGNVGIGTVTTYSQFEIKQTQNVPNSLTGSDLTNSAIRIQGTKDRNDGLYIGLMSASGDGNNQTAFIQNTWDSNFNTSFLNAAMVLNPSGGYVGIGTTNPQATLDVVGNVQCTAGYNLNYSTVPTYTSNQIGYTLSSTASSAVTNIRSTDGNFTGGITLTPGVWLVIARHTISSSYNSSIDMYLTDTTSGIVRITGAEAHGNINATYWQSLNITHIISTNSNKPINYSVVAGQNANSPNTGGNIAGYLYATRIG